MQCRSDAHLKSAKQLQAALKLILEGKPPRDFFVRCKPLSQQAIGWQPEQCDRHAFPWFWHGTTFTGDRINDVHLTLEQKQAARK
ncbi:MAG: hypothetical protein M3Y08_07440 [Fibrobacterota bacterium]|nr:hypothetical protein [Fibrobacterota bacterium]